MGMATNSGHLNENRLNKLLVDSDLRILKQRYLGTEQRFTERLCRKTD